MPETRFSLKTFDKATRDIAAAKARLDSAILARDRAAKDAYAHELTYRELAERSTELGVPLSVPRLAQIVQGRPSRAKT